MEAQPVSGFLTSPTWAPPIGPIPLGSNGQVLTMVSGIPKFTTSSGGSPGAPTTSVQFNDGGAFAGSAGFTFDKVNFTVKVTTGPVVTAIVPNYIAEGDPAGVPIYELSDQGSGVDARRWWVLASGVLQIVAVSDAGVAGGFGLQLSRPVNGTNITQSVLGAGARNLGINDNGSVLLNGSVGTAGQVPVSVGAGVAAWGNAPGYLGARLAYASPSGGAVAAAPAGFSNSTGRLNVTLAGGDATWASLTGGTDGQLLEIRNDDAANTLTLPAAVFGGVIDLNLPPKARTLLYYDATDASWERTA